MRLVVSVLLALGCSNGSTSSDGGLDASNQDALDEGTGYPTCTSLVNVGGDVSQLYVATAPVVGDGGVIIDGTYALTDAELYTGIDGSAGPTGLILRTTFSVEAGAFATVEHDEQTGNDAGSDRSASGTYETSDGGAIHLQAACPLVATGMYSSFASDGVTLHLYSNTAMLTIVRQ